MAGNIIARDILGSVAYAIRHLKTPLVVVMGHEGCGAVTAALDALDGKGDEPKYITGLLEHILPALKQLDPSLQGDRRVNAGVEANVRQSAEILTQLPMGKQAIEQNPACLAHAVYELGTGHVRFLD